MNGERGARPFAELREKLRNVQQQAAASLHSLSDATPSPTSYFPTTPIGRFGFSADGKQLNKVDCGSNLLSKWQDSWREIHEANESNCSSARMVERMAEGIHKDVKSQKDALERLNTLLIDLPVLQNYVHNLTAKIGSLCEDFDIIEAGLFELKMTDEILRLQERMEQQKMALQQHRERRKLDLESERKETVLEHERLVQEHNARLQQKLRDRQMAFEAEFNKDLAAYRERDEKRHDSLLASDDVTDGSADAERACDDAQESDGVDDEEVGGDPEGMLDEHLESVDKDEVLEMWGQMHSYQ